MLFAIICTDRPGRLDLRQQTRPAHLAYAQATAAQVRHGGPLLGEDGTPQGSLILLEAADRAAAEAFVAGDPYTRAGLFESVVIRPTRIVFRDGALVE